MLRLHLATRLALARIREEPSILGCVQVHVVAKLAAVTEDSGSDRAHDLHLPQIQILAVFPSRIYRGEVKSTLSH